MKKNYKTVRFLCAQLAAAKEHKPRSFDGFKSEAVILAAAIVTIGTKYAPSNTKISKANIDLKIAELNDVSKALLDSVNPEKDALIARNVGFEMMNKIVTDSLRAFKSSDGLTKPVELLATNKAKKVKSVRIKAIKVVPVPVADETIVIDEEKELIALRNNSVSQQQFMSRAGNFLEYITYIISQLFYKPSILHLKPAALMAYYDTLAPLNVTAEEAIAATNYKRSFRNESYFNNTTGARFLFTQVKNEFASFGSKSAEFKLVKGLAFPNLLPIKSRTPTTNY